MSNDLQPADPLDLREGPRPPTSKDSPVDHVWRFFISMRTGLALMLGIGALTLIGTLIPQAPAGMAPDSAAYAAWLDSVRADFGGWTVVLDTLGFFHMWTSWPFKVLMVLLTTSILACSVNRAPKLWRHATSPRLVMGESFFAHATLRDEVTTAASPQQAREDVEAVLRAHHYRVLPGPDTGAAHNVYAERFRFGPFGTVVSHVSFVIILIGVFLSATTGFSDGDFTATVGEDTEVGHGTGMVVAAQSFTEDRYPDGSPKDYVSDLILYKDGREVQRKDVRVNSPMRQDGVTFHQSYFGIAQQITVQDAAGRTLLDRGVPLVWPSQDGRHTIGEAVLPDEQGTTVMVVVPASGQVDPQIRAGQIQVEVYAEGSDSPQGIEVLDQGQPTEVAGLTITSVRPRQFTGLIVVRDPGANIVWLGSIGLVLGMFMVFFFPHRRIWVRIRPTEGGSRVNLAALLRKDLTFEARFHQVTNDVALAEARRGAANE